MRVSMDVAMRHEGEAAARPIFIPPGEDTPPPARRGLLQVPPRLPSPSIHHDPITTASPHRRIRDTSTARSAIVGRHGGASYLRMMCLRLPFVADIDKAAYASCKQKQATPISPSAVLDEKA